jgi:Holliday junction resolvase-like predicted endonuclease
MRERDVEKYLTGRVNQLGGLCWKWSGRVGVPDRIVMLNGGVIAFVEVKTRGGKVSKMQSLTHRKMNDLDVPVYIVWSKDDVDELMAVLSGEKIVE